MPKLQIPRDESTTHKKKKVFRTCNTYFMHIKCEECGTQALCYSHSQTDIKCKLCSTLILKSSGGKGKLTEGTAFKVAVNEY